MSFMFSNCKKIQDIQLFNFTTHNLTNMSHMFNNCSDLINLNISYFLTDKVQDMSYLLYNCKNLTYIDFSSFNTTVVNNSENMFEGLPDNGTFIYDSNLLDNNILNLIPGNWTKINTTNI